MKRSNRLRAIVAAIVNCLQAESTKMCVKQQNVMTYTHSVNSCTFWESPNLFLDHYS